MTTETDKQDYLYHIMQCPICGVVSAGAEIIINPNDPRSEEFEKPRPGDHSVCAGCGAINKFTETGMLTLSAVDLLALAVFDRPLYLHLSTKSLSFRVQIQSRCRFPSDI
jgi:hypothetical protein